MREHFTREEAESLVGQAYKTSEKGYANVPGGTVGIVVDTYEAADERHADEGSHGIVVLWLRDEDKERLETLRKHERPEEPTEAVGPWRGPGGPERPLMDHFSRADLLIRFSDGDLEGERAMRPFVPIAQPGANTDLTRLERSLALTAAAARVLGGNREVSIGPALGALDEAEQELRERVDVAKAMDAKGWLSDA